MELRSSSLCKEVFGFDRDAAFSYEDFLSTVHPEDMSMVKASIASALDPNGTGLYETDYRIIHPDGAVRWVGGKGTAFFETREGSRQPPVS